MYKFATLYPVHEPERESQQPERIMSGLGAGLATLGGLHATRKGHPWLQEKVVRGITGNKGYQANMTRHGLNKAINNKYVGSAAVALPLLYNMFSRRD